MMGTRAPGAAFRRLLSAVGLGAAGLTAGTSGLRQPGTLTVFAAASLADAFKALSQRFERSHPGSTVRFNFAGSQQLAFQLEQGALADVFASADTRWMASVSDSGLVEGEAQLFARNRLVVILPAGNPARIDRLQDLVRRGTKIVMAADPVPAGHYTREVLLKLAQAEGFGADYASRVLGNVVSQEENVKSVVAKVQLGEADAGFVYRSDVAPAVDLAVRVLEIPEGFNVVASYPIALLRRARQRELAVAFVELVLSREGQGVLERFGFSPVNSPGPAAVGR